MKDNEIKPVTEAYLDELFKKCLESKEPLNKNIFDIANALGFKTPGHVQSKEFRDWAYNHPGLQEWFRAGLKYCDKHPYKVEYHLWNDPTCPKCRELKLNNTNSGG